MSEVTTDGLPTGEGEPKPVGDMTEREVAAEGRCLAQGYLDRRGYAVLDTGWDGGDGDHVDIVAEDEGTAVLVEVEPSLVLGGDAGAMPELRIDEKRQRSLRRRGLLWLAAHPERDAVRFDVIAISIVGERCARLRHLVGAWSWSED